nr:Chain C, peptide of Gag-Pol polyprotein [synthetic construct]3JTS_F Chain F, peptide of Gag-Pol polyprotein [synthetic construct]3JTS_I Chain I, peptide of Gag-Pol polyprotein [synthetic construct]
GSENLKSLY